MLPAPVPHTRTPVTLTLTSTLILTLTQVDGSMLEEHPCRLGELLEYIGELWYVHEAQAPCTCHIHAHMHVPPQITLSVL